MNIISYKILSRPSDKLKKRRAAPDPGINGFRFHFGHILAPLSDVFFHFRLDSRNHLHPWGKPISFNGVRVQMNLAQHVAFSQQKCKLQQSPLELVWALMNTFYPPRYRSSARQAGCVRCASLTEQENEMSLLLEARSLGEKQPLISHSASSLFSGTVFKQLNIPEHPGTMHRNKYLKIKIKSSSMSRCFNEALFYLIEACAAAGIFTTSLSSMDS